MQPPRLHTAAVAAAVAAANSKVSRYRGAVVTARRRPRIVASWGSTSKASLVASSRWSLSEGGTFHQPDSSNTASPFPSRESRTHARPGFRFRAPQHTRLVRHGSMRINFAELRVRERLRVADGPSVRADRSLFRTQGFNNAQANCSPLFRSCVEKSLQWRCCRNTRFMEEVQEFLHEIPLFKFVTSKEVIKKLLEWRCRAAADAGDRHIAPGRKRSCAAWALAVVRQLRHL